MSTIRELAESAYIVAMARPTSNTGIDVIEDAIQAAVNDHTRALAEALERLLTMLASTAINIECAYKEDAEILHERESAARLALRSAGRLP